MCIIFILLYCLIADILNDVTQAHQTHGDPTKNSIVGTITTNQANLSRQDNTNRCIDTVLPCKCLATSHLAIKTTTTVMAHQLDHPHTTQRIDESLIAQLDGKLKIHQSEDRFPSHPIDSMASHQIDDSEPVFYYFVAHHITTITNASRMTANEGTNTFPYNTITHICQRDRLKVKFHPIDTANNVRNTTTASLASTALIVSMEASIHHNTASTEQLQLLSIPRHRTNSLPLRCLRTVSGEHLLVVCKCWLYPSYIGRVDTLYGWQSRSVVAASGQFNIANATKCMLEMSDHPKTWYSKATRLRTMKLHNDPYTVFGDAVFNFIFACMSAFLYFCMALMMKRDWMAMSNGNWEVTQQPLPVVAPSWSILIAGISCGCRRVLCRIYFFLLMHSVDTSLYFCMAQMDKRDWTAMRLGNWEVTQQPLPVVAPSWFKRSARLLCDFIMCDASFIYFCLCVAQVDGLSFHRNV